MEDMSELMNKVNEMLKSDSLPEELKNMVKNISNNSGDNSANQTDDISSSGDSNGGSNSSNLNSDLGIDMETILKLKSTMDRMNVKKDDPRSNLLNSLKPYLSDKKKGKIDQYEKFFNMSQMMSAFNMFGGDKK